MGIDTPGIAAPVFQPGYATLLPTLPCASIKPMMSASPHTTHSQTRSPAYARIIMLVLVLAAFGVRLINVGGESLWYDETFSAYLSAQPVPELIAHTARDIHPPAYYLFLAFWRVLSQPTVDFGLEFLLAWPSLFAGMVGVVLTGALARRLFDSTTALIAVLLITFQPTSIWFSQEVRMYALAALLYLLTLWLATILLGFKRPSASSRRRQTWDIIAYACVVAASLYTLYYALFWVITLNVVVLAHHIHRRRAEVRLPIGRWLLANLLAFILWTPWIPTFLHQALQPPVAPWREPWTGIEEVWAAITEATAALLVGHTPPGTTNWPWAMLIAVLLIVASTIAWRRRNCPMLYLLALLVLPLLGLLGVSLLGPPIYFVRYVAPFAVLTPIVLAATLTQLDPRPAAIICMSLLLVQGATLRELWTNPRYAADDHRSAVADLAHAWRPGDAIVVNAGWVYTAIATYWPTELPAPLAARPPSISNWPHLSAVVPDPSDTSFDFSHPVVVRTGTINGDPNLGWGLAESDFYALSGQAATDGIATLAEQAQSIWHYRLYDTVNDPNGVIRKALANSGNVSLQRAYPGPSYLLLERFEQAQTADTSTLNPPVAQFDNGWMLTEVHAEGASNAGETLYVTTDWQTGNDVSLPELPTVGISLRLADPVGTVYAQTDTTLATADNHALPLALRLALPVPAATPPGPYSIKLLLYDPTTLQPITPATRSDVGTTQAVEVTTVDLAQPLSIPHAPPPIAQFDYIRLLEFTGLPQAANSGESLILALTWLPRASDYRDNYMAEFILEDSQGSTAASWSVPMGTGTYPSSMWRTSLPVHQVTRLAIDTAVPPGDYKLKLTVSRAADGLNIQRRFGWLPWVTKHVQLGTITIRAPN